MNQFDFHNSYELNVTTHTGRDLLLLRLRNVHGQPRYDIPKELQKRSSGNGAK